MEHNVSEMVCLDQKDCNLNSSLQYQPKMDEFQGLIINDTDLQCLAQCQTYEKQLCTMSTENFTEI